MKKILLIEDRPKRQELFMADSNEGFEIEKYSDILDNMVGVGYDSIYHKLLDASYNIEHSVIICHRSAFGDHNSKILDKLKEYCKKNSKKLVFFSGGIANTFYSSTPADFLLLNSKLFYSKNLELFLEDCKVNEPNILILGYGINWELNILLNTLEKINYFIGMNINEDMVEYESFKTETKIDLIEKTINFKQPELHNGGVKMISLEKLSKDVLNFIKEKIVLNA